MLTPKEAYLLGHLQAGLGLHFEGALLLARQTAPEASLLAQRVAARLESVRAQRERVAADLERIEELLRRLGPAAPVPERPSVPVDFHDWNQRVLALVEPTLAAAPASLRSYRLGVLAAEAWATLTLGGTVLYLLDAEPTEARLRSAAIQLARAQERILDRLEQTTAQPDWSATERRALGVLSDTFATVPSLDPTRSAAASPARILGALAAATDRVREAIDRLE